MMAENGFYRISKFAIGVDLQRCQIDWYGDYGATYSLTGIYF